MSTTVSQSLNRHRLVLGAVLHAVLFLVYTANLLIFLACNPLFLILRIFVCAHRTLDAATMQVVEADVIVHIVDVSSPSREKQESAVTHVLDDMKVSDKPRLTLWNKLDLLPEEEQVCAHTVALGVKDELQA